MKKLATIAVGVMLAMSLVACRGSNTPDDVDTDTVASTEAAKEDTVDQPEDTQAPEEVASEEISSEEVPSEDAPASDEEKLSEEAVSQALTNYIHAKYGEDYGENLPEGTQCYWYVEPEADGIYTGILHAYTGSIMYFYIDAYTGKTDICELTPVDEDPQYVETVNFKNYMN